MIGAWSRLRSASLWQPLAVRNFRLLWGGDVISVLGDQFYLVALPWLVLEMTGSGLAVGTTLMLAGIPRAVLLAVGGAVTDRFPPRTILLVTNAARGVLVGALAALVSVDAGRMGHVYALAFLFGVADAFAYPAFTTLVALLVERAQLAAANALLQGTAHVALLIGPVFGGLLVAAAGTSPAFALDALSFVVAFAALAAIHTVRHREAEAAGDSTGAAASLRREIAAGLSYAWHHRATRGLILIIAAVNVGFVGAFGVGLPTLAHQRLSGVVAYGALLSAVGGGAVAGSVTAGAIGSTSRLGLLMRWVVLAFGLLLGAIGFTSSVAPACAATAAIGFGAGLVNVLVVAWLQARTPVDILGRVMSLVMFASVGLQPLSFALAGAVVDRHLTLTFVAGGAVVALAGTLATLTGALDEM